MDILDEVLNEEKTEKRLVTFRKILPYFIAIGIIGAVLISLFNWYYNQKSNLNQEIGDIYIDVINNNDEAFVVNSLNSIIKNNKNTLTEIAELELALKQVNNKEYDLAKANFLKIANNKNYDEITVNYAEIMWISLMLDKENLEEQDHVKMRDIFDGFNDESKAFYNSAILLKALYYKKENQNNEALRVIDKLLDNKNLPNIIAEQANALRANLINNF